MLYGDGRILLPALLPETPPLTATYPPLTDPASITGVVRVLGAARYAEMLDILQQRLAHLSAQLLQGPLLAGTLNHALHTSRGSANTLGLISLAGQLAVLEPLLLQVPANADLAQAGLRETWLQHLATCVDCCAASCTEARLQVAAVPAVHRDGA